MRKHPIYLSNKGDVNVSNKDFIKRKLELMEKDSQDGFKDLLDPLDKMAGEHETSKLIQIPDGNTWFRLKFNAVEVKQNRLVITAQRVENGLRNLSYDPSLKEYVVEFHGTRAAYLRGFYESRHRIHGWPYIYWDIRSYANHPANSEIRVYVKDFIANNEIRKMIKAMEGFYGTSNIFNSYINDNASRFKMGIANKKSPQQIEKDWSKGLMESLGYHHVEAFDEGTFKGNWEKIKVHWCKNEKDLRGGHV